MIAMIRGGTFLVQKAYLEQIFMLITNMKSGFAYGEFLGRTLNISRGAIFFNPQPRFQGGEYGRSPETCYMPHILNNLIYMGLKCLVNVYYGLYVPFRT